MKNPLKGYHGPLNSEQIAEGINVARRNAYRLLNDAKLLLDMHRYPTATALAVLSIEESGKVSILRGLIGQTSEETLRNQWRAYRDHRSKNGAYILPDLISKGARYLDDLWEVVNRNGEHTSILNSVKQLGFYTDCYGKAHWSEPEKVIDNNLAQSIVQTAKLLARPENVVTVREIELWESLVVPVIMTSNASYGLLRWATMMYEEGLSTILPKDFSQFLLGPVVT